MESSCEKTLNENKKSMENLLTAVKGFMVDLKNEIRADDERFERAMRDAKEDEILAKVHVH